MKLLKKCRWIKTFLAVILIISMASQSLTAYAQSNGSLGGTPAGTQDSDKVETVSGNTYSAYGWVISIQEVVNTATNVAAGSTESEVSFDNAWLYDFPECYYATTGNSLYSNPEKYAFIRYGSSVSSKYSVANPAGGNSYTGKLVTSYASGKGSGNFSTEAQLLEKDDAIYENILTGIKTYSLTSAEVIAAAGDTGAAINAFVKLWQDSGSVDDVINDFVLDGDDYYEQCIRYLDLLIIVNAMCNNAWSNAEESTDYIQDYLDNLNNDGSEKFVAVVVAAAVNYTTAQGGEQALMTLPVYYARRTGSTITSYISWDGVGGDWDSVRDTFNSYPTNSRTGYHMEGTDPANNTQKIWWNQGESGSAHMATTVYPVSSDGSLGFCGYTYIAPTIKIDDPDVIINPSSSNPPSSDPATDVVTPTFTVEVTTENEYMQRDTTQPVTATVTIDMGQETNVQKTIQSIYTGLKNSGESYTTILEVFIERSFGDSGGTDATTVLDNNLNDFFNNYADQSGSGYPQAAMYRYESTSTDGLFDILDGYEQIQFEDTDLLLAGIAEGTPMTATYHVGVRMAIYAEGQDPTDYENASLSWIFQGEGKTVCEGSGNNKCSNTFFVVANTGISTTQSAHDDAEWICPKGVQWYSSLRDENIDALLSQRATKHESRLLRSDELPQSPPVFAIRIIWLKNSQISYLLIQASPSDVYVSLYASIQFT